MNYFELINKCLVELNYKEVFSFAELTKNEHKKIKNIVNILNNEICNSDKWNFLLRKEELVIPKNTSEVENTIKGKIDSIIVEGNKYRYIDDFEKFFTHSQPSNTFTTFNDKLLFPLSEDTRNAEVIYYTSMHAKSIDGIEKEILIEENDYSLIPGEYAEPVLVYGTCLRLKGNPQHIRFSYWLSMYKDALANLRSKLSVNADYAPDIKMHRHS